MNKLIIGIVVLAILGAGGYFVFINRSQTSNGKTALAQIEIKDFKHNPNRLTIKAGAEVTVANREITSHSVTSDEEGLFDTGLISKDATKAFTAPAVAGEYSFHCSAHPSMTGVLVVEE
ncbi:MAG: Secreted metal-binding protein [Candidatus Woesebacteria bacterium GW2011_GWB1_43_14]|uniref:Secreted metal-binding protein n=1 Tax=Candidatus Woesebacteria bacterium GW2011_GWB1_43_14 TaxID=1618578 RepID=A0A0G1GEQ1_9BACT|nr:MAG: Secreted metal-binding protein [Candidatus Woesebacteria bacterium GW2011_GWA1_39_11b]KKS78077.1 MAG: Secreted metal-binding protein [Candidatus Woesebacteria bacterium GW2011_GWC1_42_9]KKS97343.1 MAG: Secreted metal-binding protein [Candidatus Woesebacteria bacterium GW2011_GWB1_43_14]